MRRDLQSVGAERHSIDLILGDTFSGGCSGRLMTALRCVVSIRVTPGGPDAEELKCITQLLNLFIYFSVFAMGSHYVARISLELALVTKLC